MSEEGDLLGPFFKPGQAEAHPDDRDYQTKLLDFKISLAKTEIETLRSEMMSWASMASGFILLLGGLVLIALNIT